MNVTLTRFLEDIPDSSLSVGQAQELGKIRVIVRRVILKKGQVVYVPGTRTNPIATINEVPEKALKGRPIETTVRYGGLDKHPCSR